MRASFLLAPFVALPLLLPAQTPASRNPVLVELFTSEGCSSCPPADALAAHLLHDQPVEGAQIVVLGEHVDYWDGLGWRDRFSSRQYTARQSQYSARFHLDSIYTPQMIVDGSSQFSGNDQARAHRAIAEASATMKLQLTVADFKLSGRTFSASVAASSQTPLQGELFAALVDPMDSTDVRNGENGGHRLNHVSVVRVLARIGAIQEIAGKPLAFSLKAPDGAILDGMHLIVFAQQPELGKIIGIAQSSGRESHPSAAALPASVVSPEGGGR